jgi:F-type H+-transporting ATPase subunit delta
MSKESQNAPIVMRYARALLQLSNETDQAAAVREELKGLREVLEKNPTFASLLGNLSVSESKRQALIMKAFDGRVSHNVLNFLGLLNSKGRVGHLGEIIDAYEDLMEEQLGNVEVDVTVAHKLSPDELEQVRQRVSKQLGRNAVVHQYVDESIIGGLVLRVQDKLIDASVRQQLETMRRKLLAATPK